MKTDTDTIYVRQPLSLAAPWSSSPDAKRPEGFFILENRDVLVRIFMPYANRLKLSIHYSRLEDYTAEFIKDNGYFELRIPYEEHHEGLQYVRLHADGSEMLTPALPVGWVGNRPANYIEIPHKDDAFIRADGYPRGIVSEVCYESSVLGNLQRCLVYTPPGYMKSQASYPVLYLLHGGTENETAWVNTYKADAILDRLIGEKKAVPMIVVMPNCMVRFPETDQETITWDQALEQTLIRDCIPMIDRIFRTQNDKWSRALAGLSMGSYYTNDIGLAHSDLFGWLGQFTGCMYHETDKAAYEKPYVRVMKEFNSDPEEFRKRYRVFFRSTTPREDHLDYFEKDDRICREAGITEFPEYHRILYHENTSKITSWRRGLYDFAQLLFR